MENSAGQDNAPKRTGKIAPTTLRRPVRNNPVGNNSNSGTTGTGTGTGTGGCIHCGHKKTDGNIKKATKAKASKKGGAVRTGGRVNPWLAHVKKIRAAHPNIGYKDVLIQAKKTYKTVTKATKSKKTGGGIEDLLDEMS